MRRLLLALALVLMSAAASVSLSATVCELNVAASLVPVIVTFTVPLALPSWLNTVKLSLTVWPAASSLCAPFAT